LDERSGREAEPPSAGATFGAAEALHDVSNALTVILGWLDQASRADLAREEQARALAIAARKAREARSLAREAIGASAAAPGARPIGDVVRETIDALSIEAARAGVTVTLEGPCDAEVEGAAAVGHVLTNLLLNALAFGPAGSAIRVTLETDAQALRVTVADEGPGVAPDLVHALFDGCTGRPGGAGIGLRHAREMARRLGGDLAHVPSAVGARFELRLPRRVPRNASSELPPRSLTATAMLSAVNGARVLVVEDDRAVCALLDAGLGARGAEVIAVHDEASLRARLPGLGAIDAVLLDLSPIARDVRGSLADVRRALPDAGIVFISGSAVALEEDLTTGHPRTRWVRKPFEVGEITQAISEILPARSR
jgi:CheY-like chemotaxis protein/two-component sensor histidine kinase